MPPLLLIAEREFRAYAATLSFWVALAVGPLLMAIAVGVMSLASHPARPVAVAIDAPTPAIRAAAAAALNEAAALDHRTIAVTGDGHADTRLVVKPGGDGVAQTRFEGQAPLSASAQALVARTIALTSTTARLGLSLPRAAVAPAAAETAAALKAKGEAAGRFAVVMMLWLTLTGSLGMLLQAVVRERSNRSLESLLSAASAVDIVLGKLVGVGAVSVLVLAAWLGSASILTPLAPATGALSSALVHSVATPGALLKAGAIYVLAFAFYGLITVGVGARARDTAAAQNLSRPMFALLLVAFFVAMAAAGGAAGLGWLVYLPPFTPFMLLLQAPGTMNVIGQVFALGLLLLGTTGAGWMAVAGISVSGASKVGGRVPILQA